MAQTVSGSKPDYAAAAVRGLAYCDECSAILYTKRHKCHQCKNFDYCSSCLAQASLLHPGHSFEEIIVASDQDAEAKERDDHLAEAQKHESSSAAVTPAAKVCSGCRFITERVSLVISGKAPLSDELKQASRLSFEAPVQLSKIIAAMQRRCAFCSLLLDKLIGPVPLGMGFVSQYISYEIEESWYMAADQSGETQSERQKLAEKCMDLLTKVDNDALILGVHLHRKKGSQTPNFDHMTIGGINHPKSNQLLLRALKPTGPLELELYARNGDPAAEFITTRPPNASPGSEQGFAQIRKWLDSCTESHGKTCRAVSEGTVSPLPSLVIDVSDPEKLRVHSSAGGERGKYTALSYCWGGPQAFQTTSATLADMQNGFFVTDLPRTLQDAVKLTYELGIKYLWVDSICIVQDSESHRTKEISKMGQIFKYALLTICAGRCFKAGDSFLEDRADPATAVHKNFVPFSFFELEESKTPSEGNSKAQLQAAGNIWLMETVPPLLKDPVSRRAWCLQESTLSPRVVFYDRLRSIWRCNGCVEGDGGSEVDKRLFPQDQNELNRAIIRRENSSPPEDDQGKTWSKEIHSSWQRILEDYTTRELSLDHDKFSAIGGIASEIVNLTGGAYLAGLWGQTLLQDLMWITKRKEWLLRPERWRAPTWSWASTNCPIRYDGVTEDAIAMAKIINCEIEMPRDAVPENILPASLPLLGKISEGRLTIQGQLKKLDREHAKSFVDHLHLAPAPGTALQLPFEQNIHDHILKIASPNARDRAPERISYALEPQAGVDPQAAQARIASNIAYGDKMVELLIPSLRRLLTGDQASDHAKAEEDAQAERLTPNGLALLEQMKASGITKVAGKDAFARVITPSNRAIALASPAGEAEGQGDIKDTFPENVHIMLLFRRDWVWSARENKRLDDVPCFSGLILSQKEHGGFERIGSFANEELQWLHPENPDEGVKFKPSQITII